MPPRLLTPVQLRLPTSPLAALRPLLAGVAAVALVVAAVAVAVAVAPPSAAQAQAAPATPITLRALRNAAYPLPSVDGGVATLVDGAYHGTAPGASTPVTVTFVTDAVAPTFAAVVLSTRGAGAPVETLHLVTAPSAATGTTAGAALTASPGVVLGAGVDARSVAIVGDRVRVDVARPAPGDPQCCPTGSTTLVFVRRGDGFASASDAVAGTGPSAAPAAAATASAGAGAATGPAPSPTGSAGTSVAGATKPLAALALALATLVFVGGARVATRPH